MDPSLCLFSCLVGKNVVTHNKIKGFFFIFFYFFIIIIITSGVLSTNGERALNYTIVKWLI